jgi:hypothetical protein
MTFFLSQCDTRDSNNAIFITRTIHIINVSCGAGLAKISEKCIRLGIGIGIGMF